MNILKTSIIFLLTLFAILLFGFKVDTISLYKSILAYSIMLFYSSSCMGKFSNQTYGEVYSFLSLALASLLAFSESDFIRGLDAAFLILTVYVLSSAFLHENRDVKGTLITAFVISGSHSLYSIIIENYRTTGFLSLINSILIILSIITLMSLIYVLNKEDGIQINSAKYGLLAIAISSFLVLTQSKKTDFYWDSMIWSTLIWATAASTFLCLLAARRDIFGNYIVYQFRVWHLVAFSFIVSALILIPGIYEDTETRKHVSYHLGLFTLFSENVVESGPLNKCNSVKLPYGSSGVEIGEPGGCWVYPTAWWSLPVWALLPFVSLGFDGIYSARFLSYILRASCALLIGLAVRKYSESPSAPIISVIAFLASVQVSHYGRIYTWQQFDDLFVLACIFLWWPIIFDGKEKVGKNHWLITILLSVFGPILIGFTASSVSCFFALMYLIMGNESKNLRLMVFSLIIASSISSWFIWVQALQYFYQDQNAVETFLFWKIERRSSEGGLQFSVEFWREMLLNSAYLLGPLLCLGFLIPFARPILNLQNSSKKPSLELIFSPFIFLWLVYTLVFPDVGFTHDYLAFWCLVPALSAIVGDFLGKIDRNVVISILFAFVLISSNEFRHYEKDIHESDLTHVQSWLRQNVDYQDSVLLSHDLYKEHYITAIAGRDITHAYQSTDPEMILDLIERQEITKIVTNSSGWHYWEMSQLESTYWCTEELKGEEFTYYAIKQC